MNKAGWAEVSDLVAVLRRRWDSGRYLRAYACGHPWEPVSLPVKGPAAGEILDRFEEVRKWAAAFELGAAAYFEIDHRKVGGRHVGSNMVPARARIATFDQLCSLLGTIGEVRALQELLAATHRRVPALLPWSTEHPLALLDHRESWDSVLATVEWVVAREPYGIYVRQIDVEGVDTKFVERHQRLLSTLLPLALPAERVGLLAEVGDFAGRFGFLAKPSYTRFRLLGSTLSPFPPGITELTARTDELARVPLGVSTVFVIENEVTYLAFPAVPAAMAIFGSGFASGGLAQIPWLGDKEVAYWGDIDTHGFDILSRLRRRLPDVRSVLMDHDTLLAHRRQWSTEDNPTRRPLTHLTDVEQALYQDLVANRYGTGVRLEQERVPYSVLRRALLPWAKPTQA